MDGIDGISSISFERAVLNGHFGNAKTHIGTINLNCVHVIPQKLGTGHVEELTDKVNSDAVELKKRIFDIEISPTFDSNRVRIESRIIDVHRRTLRFDGDAVL